MTIRSKRLTGHRVAFLTCTLAAVLGALAVLLAQEPARRSPGSPGSPGSPAAPAAVHDGQHDFDFLLGSWKYHLSRIDHPLSGSKKWVEFEGTGRCRPIWSGAEIDQVDLDAPSQHIEGLTLRMYNPQTRQWSLYWGTRKNGTLALPPTVGSFDPKTGRGVFFDEEVIDGHAVKVRWIWSDTTTSKPRFEQSFSTDGGKTWEPNWITTQVRVPDGTPAPSASSR